MGSDVAGEGSVTFDCGGNGSGAAGLVGHVDAPVLFPGSSAQSKRFPWVRAVEMLGRVLRGFFLRSARQAPPEFLRIGRPQDYAEGVDTRWRDEYDLWIVRNASGIYALMSAPSGPWPVVRVGISLADDGEILVDRRKAYKYEAGEWENPDSYLAIVP
jgi:hypothetical protein